MVDVSIDGLMGIQWFDEHDVGRNWLGVAMMVVLRRRCCVGSCDRKKSRMRFLRELETTEHIRRPSPPIGVSVFKFDGMKQKYRCITAARTLYNRAMKRVTKFFI